MNIPKLKPQPVVAELLLPMPVKPLAKITLLLCDLYPDAGLVMKDIGGRLQFLTTK
jgi:hypothetical protein